mgnify:CR=1 FL=1
MAYVLSILTLYWAVPKPMGLARVLELRLLWAKVGANRPLICLKEY